MRVVSSARFANYPAMDNTESRNGSISVKICSAYFLDEVRHLGTEMCRHAQIRAPGFACGEERHSLRQYYTPIIEFDAGIGLDTEFAW